MSELRPIYRTRPVAKVDPPPAEETLARLLLTLDAAQFDLLTQAIERVGQNGFGRVVLSWRDGKLDIIAAEVSWKAP